MRIFVGIPISEELQGRVLEWENKFNLSVPLGHFPSAGKDEKTVRWIAPKNLHVTLVPPREEDDIENVKRLLRSIRNDKASFDISFHKIAFGPDERRPRMIWAMGTAGEAINSLRLRINQAVGQKPDGRPFRLHCTLARIKNNFSQTFPPPFDFARGDLKNAERPAGEALPESIDWRQTVTSFVLYRPYLSPEGADYEVLATFPLR